MMTIRRRTLLVGRKRVATKPASTRLLVAKPAAALRLLSLLVSAEISEIEKLRGSGPDHAKHHAHHGGQHDQPATPGKDT